MTLPDAHSATSAQDAAPPARRRRLMGRGACTSMNHLVLVSASAGTCPCRPAEATSLNACLREYLYITRVCAVQRA